MANKSRGFSLEELEKDLRGYRQYLDDLPLILKDSRISVLEADEFDLTVQKQWQEYSRQQQRTEDALKQYETEVQHIRTKLPEMAPYSELKAKQLERELNPEESKELIRLRSGSRAAFQASSRLDTLLSVRDAYRRTLDLCQGHLNWLWALAADQSIPLEGESETKPEVQIPDNWRDLGVVSQGRAAKLIGCRSTRNVRYHAGKGHLERIPSGKITTKSIEKFLRSRRGDD